MDHQAFAEMLGNYGEFIGAIAVVVTLGYLAVQIRQNSQVSKYQFLFQIQSEWNRLSQLTIGNNEMLTLLNLCRSSSLPEELAPEDHDQVVARDAGREDHGQGQGDLQGHRLGKAELPEEG